jgi:phosphonate transport system ATP-binding protein
MVLQLIVQDAETVVLSLHAVGFALKFAERIIGLRNGEIQFDLPVEKVTQAMLRELYQNADEG